MAKNFTPSTSLTPPEVIVPEILAAGTFSFAAWNWDEDGECTSFNPDQALNTGSGNAGIHYSVDCGSQCVNYPSVVSGAAQFNLGDLPADCIACIVHQSEFSSDGLFGWGRTIYSAFERMGGT
ncbi:MAG: hypothetical protein ACK2UB_12455 [Anaerolineales bacterium]